MVQLLWKKLAISFKIIISLSFDSAVLLFDSSPWETFDLYTSFHSSSFMTAINWKKQKNPVNVYWQKNEEISCYIHTWNTTQQYKWTSYWYMQSHEWLSKPLCWMKFIHKRTSRMTTFRWSSGTEKTNCRWKRNQNSGCPWDGLAVGIDWEKVWGNFLG